MEGKTEEEVERYAKVFKERYKELNGMLQLMWLCNNLLLNVWVWKQILGQIWMSLYLLVCSTLFEKIILLVSYSQQLEWFIFWFGLILCCVELKCYTFLDWFFLYRCWYSPNATNKTLLLFLCVVVDLSILAVNQFLFRMSRFYLICAFWIVCRLWQNY